MNEFEKKIRNKLLMRGFPNEKLINNRGLIGATIDEVILEVVKNIGVTRCCETLNKKEVMSFDDWKEQNKITISKCGTKLADSEGYVFEEWELIDKYNYEVMNV